MRVVRAVVASFALVALAACGDEGGATDVTSDDLTIEVVVDVMSGVPNPQWEITGDEAADLAELIGGLPDAGPVDAAAGLDLGFRGFVLTGLDLPGDANQVRVRGTDVVLSRYDTNGTLRTDQDRTIYTMLRAMSEEHLDENVLQAIPENGLKGS